MRSIMRKLRGALGTALTWAVAWAVGGLAVATLLYMTTDVAVLGPFWELAPGYALRYGLWGLVGGALFSGALATVHGRRTLGELRPAWASLWGGLAGLLIGAGVVGALFATGTIQNFSLELDGVALALSVFGGIGAATAVGTIMLAQKGTKEIESSDPQPAIEAPQPL